MSGLGAGGNTIYGLDVTDPNFTNNNSDASAKVMGEWTYKSGDPLWQYLGNTYGKPQAIRLHNGKWGFVFGNGWCDNQDAANANCQKTDTGEAGIYLITTAYPEASPDSTKQPAAQTYTYSVTVEVTE